MDIAEMIQQADNDCDEANAELEAALGQVRLAQDREQAAMERLRELQAVRQWLTDHKPRDQRTSTPHVASSSRTAKRPTSAFRHPIGDLPQTELCLMALRSLDGPASTKDICDRIAQEGREFSVDQIRYALRHLARKDPPAVEQTEPGSGQWQLVGAHEKAEPGAPEDDWGHDYGPGGDGQAGT